MSDQNQNQTPASSSPSPAPEAATPRANITIPQGETFAVEEGLPTLASGGRQGQSKYSPLIEQAKALKVNTRFKVAMLGVPKDAFVRNIRLAIKKANLTGVKVTVEAGQDTHATVYRVA